MQCAACRKEFQEGDEVQRVPPLEVVLRGEKSGILGIYPYKGGGIRFDSLDMTHHDPRRDEEGGIDSLDFVHHNHRCYEKYFSPVDNPFLYDAIAKLVETEKEEQIREEIREELRDRFDTIKEMISDHQFNFCVDCWANLDEDEPPYCLWCKSPDNVWMHQKPQGMILCCTACNRYWNDQEEELAAPTR